METGGSDLMLVQIVLFEGFDLLDAIAPFEILSAATMLAKADYTIEFAALDGPCDVVSGSAGVKLTPAAKLDVDRADVIVVPGAVGDLEGDGPNTIPAILARVSESALAVELGKALVRPDRMVATICGGSLILGFAGLLQGRKAATHHLGMAVLGATGAIPIEARVVEDGNLISGGGVTSGLDVALHLTERLFGPRVAHAVETLFEYERRGIVWTETGAVPMAV
jgi:transcriptional regulator GlxA family with amidase domain